VHHSGNNGHYIARPEPGGNLIFGFASIPITSTTKILNNGNNMLPQSVHPGGVVVAFADGSSRFLKDDLKPHVYGHLMTSRSTWNPLTSSYSNNSTASLTPVLTPPISVNTYLQCAPEPKPYTLQPQDY
jgi:prepilin-type processing-associated H-X9-DG protein